MWYRVLVMQQNHNNWGKPNAPSYIFYEWYMRILQVVNEIYTTCTDQSDFSIYYNYDLNVCMYVCMYVCIVCIRMLACMWGVYMLALRWSHTSKEKLLVQNPCTLESSYILGCMTKGLFIISSKFPINWYQKHSCQVIVQVRTRFLKK